VERAEDGGASRGGGPKSSEAPHSIERLEEVKTAEVHVQHVQNGEPFSVKMLEKLRYQMLIATRAVLRTTIR
jgi:hypothetical protein